MSTERPAAELDLKNVYAGLIAGGLSGAVFGLIFGVGGAYFYSQFTQPLTLVATPVHQGPTSSYPAPMTVVPTSAVTTGPARSLPDRGTWRQPVPSQPVMGPPLYEPTFREPSSGPYYTPPSTTAYPTPPTGVPTESTPTELAAQPGSLVPPVTDRYATATSNPYGPVPTTPSYTPPPSSYNYAEPTPAPGQPAAYTTPVTPSREPPVEVNGARVRFYVVRYHHSIERDNSPRPNRADFQENEFHKDTREEGFRLGYYEKTMANVIVQGPTASPFRVTIVDNEHAGQGCDGVMEVEYTLAATKYRLSFDQQGEIVPAQPE